MKTFKITDQPIAVIEKVGFKAEFDPSLNLSELPSQVVVSGISYSDGVLTVQDANDQTTAKVSNGILNIV